MDELEDDENGPETDVAALMGFGSFGDQHRGKRRRYDGRAEEAVVDGGPSPSGQKKEKGSGSGSNKLPLGTGRSRAKKNSDGSSAETPSELGETVGASTRPKGSGAGRGGGGGDDAQGTGGDERGDRMEESMAVRRHAASRHDEQTRSSEEEHVLPPAQPSVTTGGPIHTSLPPKPPQPSMARSENTAPASATGGGTGAENEAWTLRKGVKLANGDIAYYDASFVEDPWRELR